VEAAVRRVVVEDAVSATAWVVAREPELLHSISDVAHLLQLGRELREHHPDVALVAHRRAVKLATGDSKSIALVSLAATLRRNEQPEEALKRVDESLALDPTLDSNVNAHTCRVAILRELGRVEEARVHGDELEARHPDDPYVLRTLAAVYREMSDDDEEFGDRARVLFLHACELDDLASEDWSFDDLILAEPAIVSILNSAATFGAGDDRFCAFDVWTNELRPRLDLIAGRQTADPRVRSERAYELVRQIAWRKLPTCRECGRLYLD
jgi:tetratricopeptide (TPR) repeat protein